MLQFRDVPIVPYSDLVAVHYPASEHRGGPIWPEFAKQLEARHCRVGRPIDDEPAPIEAVAASQEQPIAWAGPIVWHFGHQVGDFSMRLFPTLLAWPEAIFGFGTHPRSGYASLWDTPAYFREMLAWFGIREDRVRILVAPTVAPELYVVAQAEQVAGPGPSSEYLDALDELVSQRLGSFARRGVTYVSRAGMQARFAGESYLERRLASAGVRIIRPERMSLLVQLRAYVAAEQLIFAEGSALYGSQLLGRSLGHLSVLERRPRWHLAKASLEPRTLSLGYVDATAGLLHGLTPAGEPATAAGMPVLNESTLLDEFDRLGIPLAGGWRAADFAAARDADIRSWLPGEVGRPSAPGSHDVLIETMSALGISWSAITALKGTATPMHTTGSDREASPDPAPRRLRARPGPRGG